jgi:hypothetical protein
LAGTQKQKLGALSQEHGGRGAARFWLDMFNNDMGIQ